MNWNDVGYRWTNAWNKLTAPFEYEEEELLYMHRKNALLYRVQNSFYEITRAIKAEERKRLDAGAPRIDCIIARNTESSYRHRDKYS